MTRELAEAGQAFLATLDVDPSDDAVPVDLFDSQSPLLHIF